MAFDFIAFISRSTGLKMAETAFVFSQLTALTFSIIFRYFMKPTQVSVTLRYVSQFAVGLFMVIVSFGVMGILHFFLDATVCYLLTVMLNPKYCQYFVFTFSTCYMSAMHLQHQFTDRGVNNLDYIGPLMVLTEKLSSLAWSIHDGLTREDSQYNDLQKKMVVRKYPSLLQFYSFIFYPQGLLVGPVTFYAEYEDFIEGKTFTQKVKNERGEEIEVYKQPSAVKAVSTKMFITAMSAFFLLKVVPIYPIMGNVDEDFIKSHGFFYRMGYLLVSIEVAKSKYFLAWVWADAINNIAGLGFNGYDDNGKPKWDGITNIRIWNFQTATGMKTLIDNWNITGARWLRHVCYDRMPYQKKLATFLLSSMWHGFYPGFFMTFTTASIMVAAGQRVRVNLRHHFLSSPPVKAAYDVFTWTCTYVTLAYLIAPFTFLRLDLCLRYFNSLYWFIHIAAVLALLLLPARKRTKPKEKTHENGTASSHHQNGINSSNHIQSKKES